ncbi:MAG: hypothetical protein V1857_00655 [archaeon]
MSIAVAQIQRRDKRSFFGTAVRDALSESLAVLGESEKAAISYMLKRDYHVDIESPGTSLDRIFIALRGLFGQGAPYLIDLVIKKLSSKLPASSLAQLELSTSLT